MSPFDWQKEKLKKKYIQIHKNKSKSYLQSTSRNMWSTEYYSRNQLCLIRMGFFNFFVVVFLLLLVVFIFPGIPTGDPAIVAFYDKRIYIIFPKWPLISRKETASEYDKINNCAMIRPPSPYDNWRSVAQRENSN